MTKDQEYVVLECRDTLNFGRWGGEEGFALWVPREDITRVARRGNKMVKVTSTYAAMPGFAFIERSEYRELLRRAPTWLYNPRAHKFDRTGRPFTCLLSELQRMSAVLAGEANPHHVSATTAPHSEPTPVVYEVGAKVQCVAGPFATFIGIVQPNKTKQTVRVKFGTTYVSLAPKLLVLVA